MKIKLTKIHELMDAEVPNNIQVGEIRIGTINESSEHLQMPKIGQRFALTGTGNTIGFITSKVTKIISPTIFQTLNSVYKIEEIE
jgi:hypothetical protein